MSYEEGDKCTDKNCEGVLGYDKVQGCSCHINPPCSACVDNPLICLTCKMEPEEIKICSQCGGNSKDAEEIIYLRTMVEKYKASLEEVLKGGTGFWGRTTSRLMRKNSALKGTNTKLKKKIEELEKKVKNSFQWDEEHF